MSKMIQLRHVPDSLHRKLKARAARKRMSLSDYILREIAELSKLPTMDEWLDELGTHETITFKEPVVETIRKMRDGR